VTEQDAIKRISFAASIVLEHIHQLTSKHTNHSVVHAQALLKDNKTCPRLQLQDIQPCA
jgi:hypothetical protein